MIEEGYKKVTSSKPFIHVIIVKAHITVVLVKARLIQDSRFPPMGGTGRRC